MATQVFTHQPPFPGIRDAAIPFRVLKGVMPLRPANDRCHGLPISDELWDIIALCLSRQPEDRPTMAATLADLEHLFNLDDVHTEAASTPDEYDLHVEQINDLTTSLANLSPSEDLPDLTASLMERYATRERIDPQSLISWLQNNGYGRQLTWESIPPDPAAGHLCWTAVARSKHMPELPSQLCSLIPA